jgi:Tol biopolymer transport system component
MHIHHWFLGLASAALVGGLTLGGAPPSTSAGGAPGHAPAPATDRGLIAFSSGFILFDPDLSAPSQVFTVRPDGSGLRQLTHVPDGSQAGAPDLSPDGRQIAYVSNESGNFAVSVMNVDGTDQHQVFGRPGFDYLQPRWSPDGSAFAVSACDLTFGFDSECDIDVVHADGTHLRRVVGGHRYNRAPQWSPDGRMIAFDSDRGGFLSAIWVVRAHGGRAERLTDPDLEAFWPSWSPDGSQIVFTSSFDRPHGDVFVMRADGSHVRQLTNVADDSFGAGFASYSPDGSHLVLTSDVLGPQDALDLFTMRADGTGLHRIVSGQPAVTADWGTRKEHHHG